MSAFTLADFTMPGAPHFNRFVLEGKSRSCMVANVIRIRGMHRSSTIFTLLACGTISFAAHDPQDAVLSSATPLVVDALERAYALDELRDGARNPAEAALWYRQAAAEGIAIAHLRLGKMYEMGDGVPHNYTTARKHYEEAARLGLPDGHLQLAICHLEGWGGPTDRKAFLAELTIAAEAGYGPAQIILAAVYYYGFSVPEDRPAALAWAERAATQDDPEGQVVLGTLIERGRALMNDLELARTWYQLAAEAEYTTAMQKLAKTFLYGNVSKGDLKMACQWLELAIASGDVCAGYNLALIQSVHGDSVETDPDQIGRLLTMAAEGGYLQASEVLDLVEAGLPYREAFMHILRTPRAQRYVTQAESQYMDALRSGGDHPPILRRMVEPIYPLSLGLAGVTGEAQVDFIVGVSGRPVAGRLHSATHPEFGARAMQAVRQWRFHPAVKDGRPAFRRMMVPIIFTLSEDVFKGADSLLGAARFFAQVLGPPVLDDMQDARLGKSTGPLSPPSMSRVFPTERPAYAILALVLGENGVPKRGHVLKAVPDEFGPSSLASALSGKFETADGTEVFDGVTIVYLFRDRGPRTGK